jgi:atypical protein kinase C iota type
MCIPRNLSVLAASVLKAFLQKQPEDLLGSNDGLREKQQHLFFKQIDWSALEQKLIQPPFKPPVQSERDFISEPVLFTPDSSINLDRIQQNEFEGFEYINPLIMTDEIPV